MNKACRLRIYPNQEQMIQIAKTIGCCRFVYNQVLAIQEENFKSGKKHMSRIDANNYVNRTLKKEYDFLKEVDKFALTNAVYALANGYKRFFQKEGGHPKFKNKHRSSRSYTTNFTNNNIQVGDTYIKLPKLGKVKAVIHRTFPGDWKIKSATLKQESDGSYYVSVLYQYDEVISSVFAEYDAVIGMDYKSDGLYMDSNGTIGGTHKYYRESQQKLAKGQRKLKHKQLGSKNYYKQQKRVACIHRKAVNQRKDHLHKRSTEIANQYALVCVENLNMTVMSNKGFGNGKATLDNGYGMFLNMLEYKLRDRGKAFVKVDKWFPSSQLCSNCGKIHKIALTERIYLCECGNEVDRDYNAAVNIKNEGYRIYQKAV